MATPIQIQEQKNMGLDIGCHLCRREPDYIDRPLTMRDLNPHCINCKRLYCRRHQSIRDIHYCSFCLP